MLLVAISTVVFLAMQGRARAAIPPNSLPIQTRVCHRNRLASASPLPPAGRPRPPRPMRMGRRHAAAACRRGHRGRHMIKIKSASPNWCSKMALKSSFRGHAGSGSMTRKCAGSRSEVFPRCAAAGRRIHDPRTLVRSDRPWHPVRLLRRRGRRVGSARLSRRSHLAQLDDARPSLRQRNSAQEKSGGAVPGGKQAQRLAANEAKFALRVRPIWRRERIEPLVVDRHLGLGSGFARRAD